MVGKEMLTCPAPERVEGPAPEPVEDPSRRLSLSKAEGQLEWSGFDKPGFDKLSLRLL